MSDRRMAEYRADALGAPFPIVLVDSVSIVDDAVCLPDMEDLIAVVGLTRLRQEERLTGDELRFLRRSAGLSREDLGRGFGGTADDVDGYEHGPRPMTAGLEKYIRLHLHHHLERMLIDRAGDPPIMAYMEWIFGWRPMLRDVARETQIRLRHRPGGWEMDVP